MNHIKLYEGFSTLSEFQALKPGDIVKYMGDTYEVFLKALAGVKIEEIKNDKWLFLGWYGFFLKNLRIKYVKEIFKQRENETSLFRSGGDGKEYLLTDVAEIYAPDAYEEIEDRMAFKSIYKELTVRQRFIVDHKKLNYKSNEIAKMLVSFIKGRKHYLSVGAEQGDVDTS